MGDKERDSLLEKIRILEEKNMDLEEYIDKRLEQIKKETKKEIWYEINKAISR